MCLQSHLKFSRFIWFMLSGLPRFYVCRKKWGFVSSFCVLICVDSRIMKVLLSLVGNPTFAPTTWLDLNAFFVLFEAMTFWSTNGILYLFSVDLQIQEKHFFPKINAYLNILNQIYISLYSSNTFSFTDGILCVFSLILNTRKNVSFG